MSDVIETPVVTEPVASVPEPLTCKDCMFYMVDADRGHMCDFPMSTYNPFGYHSLESLEPCKLFVKR